MVFGLNDRQENKPHQWFKSHSYLFELVVENIKYTK